MRRRDQRRILSETLWRKWTLPYIAVLAPARQRFVQEAVHGILASGSMVLSDMARGVQKTSTRFFQILKRFSYNLSTKAWAPGTLHDELLERNAEWVRKDTPVLIDLSEIAKPHARKMPHLATIRDASSPDKRKCSGYWLVEAYAEPSRGVVVPLMLVLFSTRQRKFVSQNAIVINALERLHALLGERGIFVFDRGFDGRRYFDALLELRHRFVVRLRDSRDLVCNDGIKRRVSRLALRLVRPLDDRGATRASIVRLPGRDEPLLFTAEPKCVGDPRPIKLLAWLDADGEDLLRQCRRCRRLYHRRWKAEDGIRFLKSALGLEKVRVMSWRGLHHMMALALLAMTIIALTTLEPPQWCAQLIRQGRSRNVDADFLFYRIFRGIAHLLQRHPLF